MPYPHPEPLSLRQTTADPYLHKKCSNTVLSQSLWGPWVLVHTRFFEPSEHLWWECGLILNTNSPLLPSCWGFSFALGCGVSPHSHSSTYRLTGVSLTLGVRYWSSTVQLPLAWFQIGKGVCQGCILSPGLFNFYAEYIIRNAELDEA